MTQTEHTDVLIAGAGPAGVTTALALQKYAPHLSVVVIDAESFPRDKTCGDGLGPSTLQALTDLGALEVLADYAPMPTVEFGGPNGTQGTLPTHQHSDLQLHVIPREIFDHRLVELAQRRGIDIREKHEFLSTELTAHGREITLRAEGSEHTVGARVLIGADGAYSRVRRSLGIKANDEKYRALASRVYGTVKSGKLSFRIDFISELLPAYGWVFPTSPTTANIGVGNGIELLKRENRKLRDLFADYLTYLESAHGLRFTDVSPLASHQLPHSRQLPPLAGNRFALVGDAGSMINPLSGEGIAYAMRAAMMLAQELAGATDSATDNEHLAAYARRFKREFRTHIRASYAFHRSLAKPRLATALMRAATANEQVMATAARLAFGEEPLRLGTVPHIVRRVLQHGIKH